MGGVLGFSETLNPCLRRVLEKSDKKTYVNFYSQQQVATPNATSGGQFPKPSYNSGYGSTSYDTLNQTTQDYNKTPYASSGVGQQSKGQTVSNPQTGGTGSDITSSMYGKSHAALNKVNVSPDLPM